MLEVLRVVWLLMLAVGVAVVAVPMVGECQLDYLILHDGSINERTVQRHRVSDT